MFLGDVVEVVPYVQHYDWGARGAESLVRQLRPPTSVKADEDNKPYAELWVGYHPAGMNRMVRSGETIEEFMRSNKGFFVGAGAEENSRPARDLLPYLFKVLSVRAPLSIQCHPDRQQAKLLHATQPKTYDETHKPEVTVAVSPFEAMCGFRDWAAISTALRELPEFRSILGEEYFAAHLDALSTEKTETSAQRITAAIKDCFRILMETSVDKVAQHLKDLLERIAKPSTNDKQLSPNIMEALADQFKLFKVLHNNFPGDVGCFSAFLLNHLHLEPGQAFYISPNILHAYISGDCIECMPNSDNVIRGGLTPKHKDINLLLEIASYSPSTPTMITPSLDSSVSATPGASLQFYRAPPSVNEFKIFRLELPPPSAKEQQGASVSTTWRSICCFIVLEGSVKVTEASGTSEVFGRGSCAFIRMGSTVQFAAASANCTKQPAVIFGATVPSAGDA